MLVIAPARPDILLLGQARTPVEVAEILDTRKESIYQWRDNSMAGLAEGHAAA